MNPLARLLNLVRRDGPIEALAKIARYSRWRLADRWMQLRLARLPDAEDRFTYIYKVNYWQARESVSGPGSSLDASQPLRRALPILFEKFSIRSIFDAPCGDFNWMKAVVDQCGIAYRGADIVRPLIEHNIARHSSATVHFAHMDITRDPFPAADLWLCRDCFYHLSNDDILRTLQRFVGSPIRYMLTSTYRNAPEPRNPDIVTGLYHLTDLFAAPFSLPRDVLFRIEDQDNSDLCLWSREQVAASLAGRGAEGRR